MKIISLPILGNSIHQEGIVLHLTHSPAAVSPFEPVKNMLAVLSDLADPLFIESLVSFIMSAQRRAASGQANQGRQVFDAMHLPDGNRLVAAAPDYVPTLMSVADKEHELVGHVGELLFADENCIYLWFPHREETVGFTPNQVKKTTIGRR
jgi:hypothetical protein